MFWALWHQSTSTYSQPSFSSYTWKRGGVWMCKLGVISQEWLKTQVKLLLSANRKSYMPHWLPQQRMTSNDLECLKSTSSASSAISEVPELLVLLYALWRRTRDVWDTFNVFLSLMNQLIEWWLAFTYKNVPFSFKGAATYLSALKMAVKWCACCGRTIQ